MANINFLKEDGEDFEVGDTVTIESTVKGKNPFEDTRTKEDPDTVTITIEDTYSSNTVINTQDMGRNDTGEYFFNWDTAGNGIDAGDYKVTVNVEGSGSKEEESDWIRLQE